MTIYTINPNTWTKIGDGDCVVISEYRTELVYFRLDNGESVTSYLGKQLLVKNTGDLFAKSHSRTIEVKSTVADAAVRKNAADIITTNTALTANTDNDLVTKNALEAKDILLEQSIDDNNEAAMQALQNNSDADALTKSELEANTLADTALAGLVAELEGRVGSLETAPESETVFNHNTGNRIKIWVGTQAEYDALTTKDSDILYIKTFDSLEVPVEPSGDMGLREDYSGTGWYKATDTGTVFNKGVPALETHVFSDSPTEYVSVYTKEDAKLYGERAATSNLTDMSNMFYQEFSFNQDISSWDVSNVTSMSYMFYEATVFNQDLSSWDVISVTDMEYMFGEATSFNSDLSSWDVSSVINMGNMFYNATSFNSDISNWNVSSVIDMSYMFNNVTSFNQDLSGWCVSKIPSLPSSFETNSALTPEQLPVWGTCPRGEDSV